MIWVAESAFWHDVHTALDHMIFKIGVLYAFR